MVLNAAARLVIVGSGKFDHVTPVLRDVLHRLILPVTQRIQLTVALAAIDCVRGSDPAYFSVFCIPVADVYSRSNVRSPTRIRLGCRSFHVAVPVAQNAFPINLRSTSISREQFRARMKTHLFSQSYDIL